MQNGNFRGESRTGLFLFSIFLLIVLALGVYSRVSKFEFVSYDDNEYVTQNEHVASGLTPANIQWAFTNSFVSNWHPLTWISHMIDVEIHGLNPGGHHVTNLLIHILNTILLFIILFRMTQAWGQSLFVAAVFAVHPLHVESVAWISERKDLLSLFFMLLASWAYISYTKKPGLKRYIISILLFICGLMSKQMLMTFPFILLLLDYWPLGRINKDEQKEKVTFASIKKLFVEKIPFFVLSIASGVIVVLTQSGGGAIGTLSAYPILSRLSNAILAYQSYLVKTFWPAGLSVHYPYEKSPHILSVLIALFLLVTISFFAARFWQKAPYFIVGWLWYGVTLIPVIGLVQIGQQSRADRYTYIPLIGLLMIVGWGLPNLLYLSKELRQRPLVKSALAGVAAITIVLLVLAARSQAEYWKSSESLFRHSLAVTTGNAVMHSKLALCLMDQGRLEEAIMQYEESLRINPLSFESHNNLGNILNGQNKLDEAIAHYEAAIKIDPRSAEAHNNDGVALNKLGRSQDALAQYLEALSLNRDYPEAHHNIASLYGKMGDLEKAIYHDSQAIRLRAHYAEAHYNLAVSFYLKGEYSKAKAEVDQCIKDGGYVPAAFMEAINKKSVQR
jgi:protein O-mannosyl-transferase